jgi:hypothetical protein
MLLPGLNRCHRHCQPALRVPRYRPCSVALAGLAREAGLHRTQCDRADSDVPVVRKERDNPPLPASPGHAVPPVYVQSELPSRPVHDFGQRPFRATSHTRLSSPPRASPARSLSTNGPCGTLTGARFLPTGSEPEARLLSRGNGHASNRYPSRTDFPPHASGTPANRASMLVPVRRAAIPASCPGSRNRRGSSSPPAQRQVECTPAGVFNKVPFSPHSKRAPALAGTSVSGDEALDSDRPEIVAAERTGGDDTQGWGAASRRPRSEAESQTMRSEPGPRMDRRARTKADAGVGRRLSDLRTGRDGRGDRSPT